MLKTTKVLILGVIHGQSWTPQIQELSQVSVPFLLHRRIRSTYANIDWVVATSELFAKMDQGAKIMIGTRGHRWNEFATELQMIKSVQCMIGVKLTDTQVLIKLFALTVLAVPNTIGMIAHLCEAHEDLRKEKLRNVLQSHKFNQHRYLYQLWKHQ